MGGTRSCGLSGACFSLFGTKPGLVFSEFFFASHRMTPRPDPPTAAAAVTAAADPVKPTPARQSKLGKLLDPRRHTDHKVTGLGYIISFALATYLITFHIDYYESTLLYHCLPAIIGCLVCMSALRNFKFLPKKAENPGMFAKNRTFSYAFLVENLWFQILVAMSIFSVHPLAASVIPHPMQIAIVYFMFVYREFVPKTSYGSWEVGNNKVNSRSDGRVTFINIQVKLVRWNYVLKKGLLFYLFVVSQGEWLFGFPIGTWMTQYDRVLYYLLSMDAMHNITTAFFLQTLKFKGFISAETFSFLFNASPIVGVFLTIRLFQYHTFIWPYLLGVLIETAINLKLIYPSKLSFEWKNRCQVTAKALTVVAATSYLYLTL